MDCRRFRDLGRVDVVTILFAIVLVLVIVLLWRRV